MARPELLNLTILRGHRTVEETSTTDDRDGDLSRYLRDAARRDAGRNADVGDYHMVVKLGSAPHRTYRNVVATEED